MARRRAAKETSSSTVLQRTFVVTNSSELSIDRSTRDLAARWIIFSGAYCYRFRVVGDTDVLEMQVAQRAQPESRARLRGPGRMYRSWVLGCRSEGTLDFSKTRKDTVLIRDDDWIGAASPVYT